MTGVTTKLYGRLGNWLFMIAATIAYSLRHNIPYYIPTAGTNFGERITYDLGIPRQDVKLQRLYREKNHNYTPIPKLNSICLYGHFQSEKYFEDHRDEIRTIISFPEPTLDKCAIHVRRGDYLTDSESFPVLPISYYDQAITQMREMGVNDFMVFSDDIKWCKENIGDEMFEYVSGDPVTDMRLMASCKHQIIANSSYSLFPALLSIKTVISPHTDNWFGERKKHLNLKDLLPERFIKIPITS